MKKQIFYQLDTKGKVREWSIEVEDNSTYSTIIVNTGLKDGKKIETLTNITVGMNIGKSNETTHYQQACKDAQSEIDKRIKKGYVTDITQIKSKGETATIKAPMKGYSYHPTGKNKALTLSDLKIRDEKVLLQVKLDGFRGRIHVTKDEVTFYSSGGDVIPSFPKIEKSIRNSFDKIYSYVNSKYGINEYYLDGEYYNHDLGFQKVASACGTRVNITPEKEVLRNQIQFYLFDVCLDAPYSTRSKVLEYFYDKDIVLETPGKYIMANEKEIDSYFEEVLKRGYEGLMIRTLQTPYEFKRSKQLTKYKPLLDSEYKIIGFKQSITGETLGAIEFQMEDGKTFYANPKDEFGTDEMKLTIWNNKKDYLGKYATVEFLNFTDEGLPRHPRVKGFRKGKSKD